MTFGLLENLPSQVVAIPMTSFGMLMNSPHSEFQKIIPPKTPFSKVIGIISPVQFAHWAVHSN